MQDHSIPKKCRDCGEEKDKSEFDPKSPACKECRNARFRKYYADRTAGIENPKTDPIKKQCSKCGKEKPVTDFHRAVRYRLGVTGQCRDCKREYTSQHEKHIAQGPKPIRGSKVCPKCLIEKKFSQFSCCPSKKDGRSSRCKECRRSYERVEARPGDEYRRSKENYLWSRYKLKLEDFQRMLAVQGSACGICGIEMQRPFVDHCHVTGKIRGLLCCKCNTSLGNIEVSGFLHNSRRYLGVEAWQCLMGSSGPASRADPKQ